MKTVHLLIVLSVVCSTAYSQSKYLKINEYSEAGCTGYITSSKWEGAGCRSFLGPDGHYQKIVQTGNTIRTNVYNNSNCTGTPKDEFSLIHTTKAGQCDKAGDGGGPPTGMDDSVNIKNYTYTMIDDPKADYTKGKDYYVETAFNSGDCTGKLTSEEFKVLGDCTSAFFGYSEKYALVSKKITHSEYTNSEDCTGSSTDKIIPDKTCTISLPAGVPGIPGGGGAPGGGGGDSGGGGGGTPGGGGGGGGPGRRLLMDPDHGGYGGYGGYGGPGGSGLLDNYTTLISLPVLNPKFFIKQAIVFKGVNKAGVEKKLKGYQAAIAKAIGVAAMDVTIDSVEVVGSSRRGLLSRAGDQAQINQRTSAADAKSARGLNDKMSDKKNFDKKLAEEAKAQTGDDVTADSKKTQVLDENQKPTTLEEEKLSTGNFYEISKVAIIIVLLVTTHLLHL